MNVVIVDNYDSFTYNLFDLVYRVSGIQPSVFKNDALSLESFEKVAADCVILSPGPGHPGRRRDFGISADILGSSNKPILGVCLGHQGIAAAFGGQVIHAKIPVHGLSEPINHDGAALFRSIPQRVKMVRYHSLIVADNLPQSLAKTAWTDDGQVMGIRHKTRPIFGVQFHPESICSEFGETLMANFFGIVKHEI
jgi:para-aminobenzoate synthetase